MTIRANILQVQNAMLNEIGKTKKPTCDKVQDLSLRAIDAGKGSEFWEEYMKLFVDPGGNQQQLDRLMARDGTEGDEEMNLARAYLVADGPCAAGARP